MSSGGKNGIVSFLFFLLFFSPPPSAAQLTDSNIGHESYPRFTPTMAMIIAGLVVALFFMGFFSIYLRNCSRSGGNGSSVRPVNVGAWRGRRDEMRGLEASVIETFPTMVYSEVKVHKIGKGALECAVCLNEFEDDETLRLIPKCNHVFHAECIDPWLASHVTCPVCRANLDTQPGDPVSQPTELDNTVIELDLEAQNNDNDLEIREERRENQNINIINSDVEARVSLEVEIINVNQILNMNYTRKPFFPRSHSTGHSLVQPSENTDRFTFQLPIDVRKQLLNRKLNRATSLVLPKERSSLTRKNDYGSSR
uniref:RING-type E3 ubiquitin transferase n=2 Tax=Gossypium raimondii TaxID=29730 RepID=A0A0D2N359_GOSRA|nr:hypothetical protein B456_004G242900 [Gossypium raimondii]